MNKKGELEGENQITVIGKDRYTIYNIMFYILCIFTDSILL